jgi:hypothetical protein
MRRFAMRAGAIVILTLALVLGVGCGDDDDGDSCVMQTTGIAGVAPDYDGDMDPYIQRAAEACGGWPL